MLVGLVVALLVTLPQFSWALAHGQISGSGPVGAASVDVDSISVGVDEASGSATLSVPIDLPPGPNGQKPNLSFSYSSQRASGLLGVGWALALPRISCSHRFGVPDYAACARFELDGQVLVGPDATNAYHSFEETFTQFTRQSTGTASVWQSLSTDGSRMSFGLSPESRVGTQGGIAEWHLARIEDVFGNRIDFEYSAGPVGDEGELRPRRITYAEGHREILFVYEPRPDPSFSYRGGVRRALSERLREVRVRVNDRLHHRLILDYESARTTTQSRLIAIQRFGSDCEPAAHADPDPSQCSALPAAEFTYTDSGRIEAAERWEDTGEPGAASTSPTWYAPPEARFSTGDPFVRGQSTQFADINGDGFPDLVTDQTGRHDDEQYIDSQFGLAVPPPGASPFVHLSDGTEGWEVPTWNGGDPEPARAVNTPDNPSALWTDRMRALRFDIPALRVKQVYSFDPRTRPSFNSTGGVGNIAVALGSCIDEGEALPAVEFLEDAGSVQYGGRQAGGAAPYFDASAFRNAEPGHPVSPTPPYTTPAESEIRVWPHFQIVDLNADGLADMVMSIHLSGFYLSMDDCASAEVQSVDDATWIPGDAARVVFMNTGDDFVLDDGRDASDGNYADTLPLFGIVAFESGDLAYEEIGKGIPRDTGTGQIASACDDFGLAGLRNLAQNYFVTSWDFCIAPIDLAPVFQDLNGDGYPDIIVKRPFDPTQPGNPDYADGLFYNYRPDPAHPFNFEPVHRVGAFESVAWLQDPDAQGSAPRWIRAPAYDPPLDHALIAQFELDSPGGVLAPGLVDARGNAQIYNIDNGVRLSDVNRDGLSDILVSPRGTLLGLYGTEGAALINRGAQDPVGAARYSAWCSSSPLATVAHCPDAMRYAPQHPWVANYSVFNSGAGSPVGSVTVIPQQRLVSLADFNGDGWVDMMFSNDSGAYSGVYVHNPGAAGSVWQKDERFTPLEPNMYEDAPSGNYDGNAIALPSGYGIADVNGDGVVDLVGSDRSHMPAKHSWISTPESARSDLLEEVRNGQGLVVRLEFASALQQRDTELEARAWAHSVEPGSDADPSNDGLAEPPGPDPTWPDVDDRVSWSEGAVLAAKTVASPGRVEARTTYAYAHPRRCHKHKTAHGYRLVESTRADGSTVERFYYQKHGRIGKLAQQVTRDESGAPIGFRSEVWELPDPSQVTGGFADFAATDDWSVAYIGRLKSTTSRNEYGGELGETIGFESTTRFEYDDGHGYNFVAEVLEERPGQSSRTLRWPHAPDPTNHLRNRPRRLQTFANQGGDRRLLSDVVFSYLGLDYAATHNKVGRRRTLDARRDGSGASRWIRTDFRYADNGNLLEERDRVEDVSGAEGRSTLYCYDGDSGCVAGQSSRSLLVGVRDAHGQWTRRDPHPTFAAFERTRSDYHDVPSIRFEFDALGRAIERWHEPSDGSAPVRLSQTIFEDFPIPDGSAAGAIPPYRVEKRFATSEPASAIETIAVADALGGTSLSIELLDSVSSGAASLAAVATEEKSDPNMRVSWLSEPFACGVVASSGPEDYATVVSSCRAVAGEDKTWTKTTRDAAARPVQIETPLGTERFRYRAEELLVLGSGPRTPHDAVLHADANGGLRESVLADGKAVRVRECKNLSLGSSLEGVSCLEADETRLFYEPTGELRERVDPTLADNGVYDAYSVGPFSNQRLRFSRDTLGRVIEIADPDAGTSHQTYDVFGNLIASRDARGVTVHHEYDALDRRTRIQVDGEIPSEILYDEDLLKRERVVDGDISKFYSYDDLGRVRREIRWVDGQMLKIDRQRDFLGRTTEIRYPTVLGGAVDTIAYEYEGVRLGRVCDLGVAGPFAGDCSWSTATPIVSGVDYDALGRVARIEVPGGERLFSYDGHSTRRTEDVFVSSVPGGGEDVRFSYQMPAPGGAGLVGAYDGLGQLLQVEARVAEHEYRMTYGFDARRRIDSWTWDPDNTGAGTVSDYAYDARGNMVRKAGAVQDYASLATAHAIQSRASGGVTTDYDYDAAGHLASRTRSTGESTHYRFDGRGRLVCIGTAVAGCDRLGVTYNGEGERIKESGAYTDLHAGPNFRLRRTASGGQEYWIEIHALGERVAYKHVSGGALRIVGLLPEWAWPNPLGIEERRVAAVLFVGLFPMLVLLVLSGRAPLRDAISLGLVALSTILPVQARAGGVMTNADVEGSAVYRWVLTDMIGSGLVEIDSAGQFLSHTAFDPFGGVATQSGSTGVGGRSYFAGHDRQLNNDLVYMKARWMDPETGAFMSVDPLTPDARDPQSFNGYAYARNNPVSLVDPTGMDWRIVWTDPDTGKVTSKGSWQSGSSKKAAAFVDGVKSGAITPATITANLNASGGSENQGTSSGVGAGPPAGPDFVDPSEASQHRSLAPNERRTLDYLNNEIAGHEAAISDLEAQNRTLRAELSRIDHDLRANDQEISDLADSAQAVRSYQQLDALYSRLAAEGVRALALSFERESVQARYDSNVSFIRGHAVQLGYLRQDLAEFREILR